MSVTAFAIAPQTNADGKNDATGAFHPGAHKFAKAYGCSWRQFKNSGSNAADKKSFYDTIDSFCPGGTSLFAYFGHGLHWSTYKGLASPHVYIEQLDEFLEVLRPKISFPFVFANYSCSCGSAQGFNGALREKLGGDTWVYGHTSVGHTFMNPDVSEESSTGPWRMLYPLGAELRAAWAEALKYTDLWLRFPLMTDDTIAAELNARRLLGKWEVTGGETWHYVFDDTDGTAWTVDSDREINADPVGTVKAFDPKNARTPVDAGTWVITDKVSIAWDSGEKETMPITLRVAGQSVMNNGTIRTARRLSHPFSHGKLQG
ncbi:MAG TPA: hypothetical protein VGF55_05610 [Gemmataceae bacterium]|jgi:hypothetical protein